MNTMQKVSLVLVLFFSVMTFGQKNWNRVSVETGFGYVSSSNLFGSSFSKKSDFSGFNHFDLGVRYMIDQNFGVKLGYGRDRFSSKDAGITYNSFDLAAVYNLGNLFNLKYATNERVGLLGHAGIGLTYAKPEQISDSERIGSATIGLTPQVKISDRIGFYGDISYAFRFKQQYGFDGVLLSPDYKDKVGKTTVFSLGLIFYLGDKNKHADWY